jgi:Fe-S-cluster-containing dehydrogenase component
MSDEYNKSGRRDFLKSCTRLIPSGFLFFGTMGASQILFGQNGAEYDPDMHDYAMGIDIHRCIGCGRCAAACKRENKVPPDPHFFRTWVERYVIPTEGEALVDSPNGGISGFPELDTDIDVLRTFFVPKLCNHCANPPCVQVCPVGATFVSRDGVVLVDESYCVGCRYCIQACPYGARYLHPEKHVADKCTFCYHRIVKGLLPACVEVCPSQARVFGEVGHRSSPIRRFVRFNDITVLKPSLNTEPKVYYAGAGVEVR